MARWKVLLFGVLLVSAAVPNFASAQNAAPRPTAQQEQLLKLIREPLPSQATKQGALAFYVPDNLYQYMDGGAEIFLAYDVQMLMHQDFRAKEVEVTVDVFDMGTPESAFGIYAAERSPNYHFVPIGAEGYQNEGILNFLLGRYYVKLAAFDDGADAVLEQFAKTLSARIEDSAALPALLQQLPQTNRKPHSEQYLPKDPLGHPFLGPAYTVTYGSGNQESILLVSVAQNEAEAKRRFETLAQHFRSTGQCEPAPELGEGVIRASNSFEGKFVARAKGKYVVLLSNPVAGVRELLNDTVERLK